MLIYDDKNFTLGQLGMFAMTTFTCLPNGEQSDSKQEV